MTSLLLALAMQVAAQPPAARAKADRATLDATADSCGAPRKWLARRGNEVLFRPDRDADFKKIECVLRKISTVVATSSIAFIGNEQLSEEK